MDEQTAKLQTLRNSRDNAKVEATLNRLKEAAGTSDNLMPYILDAVKSYATIGEITGVLKEVFGEYQQSVSL